MFDGGDVPEHETITGLTQRAHGVDMTLRRHVPAGNSWSEQLHCFPKFWASQMHIIIIYVLHTPAKKLYVQL